MEPVQIIGIIVGLIVILKIAVQAKKSAISPFTAVIWILGWIFVMLMVSFPNFLGKIANSLGVGRGIDVLVYFGIIILFFLVYKSYLRSEHLEREITTIVSEIAINERYDKKTKGENDGK
ncbi:hypothetical protein HNP86_000067 [Methanococcus maripaludis]|uniref:DUF2304 domain-containing protein n=1 Tax=Methanococcus maripaludis TaxID=39152 RepID=A0A7J9NW32_METMI|nr:DUF2304 domain-containing protein [Methanococcus maripaludis]MBA2849936.1 hypothetical protein [Methanococcus maripaludis]